MLNGRFDLQERLGDGGMGEVWRAFDNVLGRSVALKMPLPHLARDPVYVARFRREARTMANIRHPNVIVIHELCDSAGGPFIVMEYVDGESLANRLSRRGHLSPAETLSIVAQAARALHAAHEKNVVHRDVKPGNLLLRSDGSAAVLTDFGIAKTPTANVLTSSGQMFGTATYMAPELAQGADASAQSDIYALGVVAYQCLSGAPPFEAGEPVRVAMMHVNNAPKPLPPDVPPMVRKLVGRAMAKRPASRYATAAELAQHAHQIEQALRHSTATVSSTRPEPRPRAGASVRPQAGAIRSQERERRRSRFALPAFLAVVLLVAFATAMYAIVNRNDRASSDSTKGVPADLRTFAPNWPFSRCTKDPAPASTQSERWHCNMDESTQLFIIRYSKAKFRNDKWEENRVLVPGSGMKANWKQGDVIGPSGKKSRYVEFEVNVGTANDSDWHEAIWWDQGPGEPPFALLLTTTATPTAQQALDHIRGFWTTARYNQPK